MRTTALLLLLTGATSGNPHPTQGNTTASEGTCSYEVGLDYHNGQGMGATAAESADDCCAQCSSEEGQKKGMSTELLLSPSPLPLAYVLKQGWQRGFV